mgnify:FL=1
MRRESRRREQGFETKKALYISGSILAVAIIGFVVAFLSYGNGNDSTNYEIAKIDTNIIEERTENTQTTGTEFGRTVNEMENITENVTKYAVNTSKQEEEEKENKTSEKSKNTKSQNTQTKNTKKEQTQTKTDSSTKQDTKSTENPAFKNPVEGEVIKEYAKDKLVYSNTLGEWIVHGGIDIKANKTTVVKASAEGTVKSIKNDPRYGLTVIVEHSNGFTSVYSNLLTAEFVVEGEKIKQGQTIGTVGTTATFEISDEPHLHFEIRKDGNSLDPTLYLKN